jgi:hypothetical protein
MLLAVLESGKEKRCKEKVNRKSNLQEDSCQ